MTIGELESKTGVHASTIRYWERIRLLPTAARVAASADTNPMRSTL